MDLDLSLPTGKGVAIYPAGATFGPRVMRDFEFVWLIEGDAQYRWGDVIVDAPEGAIVLCRPGATDSFRWDQHRRTRHGYYHFNLLKMPKNWPAVDTWPLVRQPQEGDVLRPLFRHLLTWSGRGNDLLCKLTMAHMLTAFVFGETAAGDVPREALPDAVDRAWSFIRQRIEERPETDIDLSELARVACVTPEHLCRLFKSVLGHSPVETVRLARLDRAAVLLARSNYSVGEIAHMCGFASQFHFSRRFKQAYGTSPLQLRKSIQDGAAAPLPRLLMFSATIGKPGPGLRYAGGKRSK